MFSPLLLNPRPPPPPPPPPVRGGAGGDRAGNEAGEERARPVCPPIGWEEKKRGRQGMTTELFEATLNPFRFRSQLRTETWFRSSLTDFEMYRDILFFKDPPPHLHTQTPTPTPPPISARPHTHTLKTANRKDRGRWQTFLKAKFPHTATPKELLVCRGDKASGGFSL